MPASEELLGGKDLTGRISLRDHQKHETPSLSGYFFRGIYGGYPGSVSIRGMKARTHGQCQSLNTRMAMHFRK